MKRSTRPSGADEQVLQALTTKLPRLSQRQVADHWHREDAANARRQARRLDGLGLIALTEEFATPPPATTAPLAVWRRGDPIPELGAIAYRAAERVRCRPARRLRTWSATQAAADLYGGACRDPLAHTLQVSHDLGVASVWLRLREAAPLWADAWTGEDMHHFEWGEKRPDALVTTPEQIWAIDYCGPSYTAERLGELIDHCARKGLGLQLW